MKVEAENWCSGCEKSCCDHFVLENWPEQKMTDLLTMFPFLRVHEHWVGEEEDGRDVHVWIMECDRLMEDGSCEGYPDNRPYFCEWAGVRYPVKTGCKLFENVMKNNIDRCE